MRGTSFQLGEKCCDLLLCDPVAGNFPSHPPQQHVTHLTALLHLIESDHKK